MSQNLEIERKYLIRTPNVWQLRWECSHVYSIEQTYLLQTKENVTARVRGRSEKGLNRYFYTEKEFRTDVTCVERERELHRREYERYLQDRDPALRTIYKTRYCLPVEDLTFEIDVYPFWYGVAVMEVELSHEQQEIHFPKGIEVLCEVTHDRRLKNAALAGKVPTEAELLAEYGLGK